MSHLKGGEGASDYITGVLGEVYLLQTAIYGAYSCTESAVAYIEVLTLPPILLPHYNLSQTKSISKYSMACTLLNVACTLL